MSSQAWPESSRRGYAGQISILGMAHRGVGLAGVMGEELESIVDPVTDNSEFQAPGHSEALQPSNLRALDEALLLYGRTNTQCPQQCRREWKTTGNEHDVHLQMNG